MDGMPCHAERCGGDEGYGKGLVACAVNVPSELGVTVNCDGGHPSLAAVWGLPIVAIRWFRAGLVPN